MAPRGARGTTLAGPRGRGLAMLAVAVSCLGTSVARAQERTPANAETIVEVRVHGNHTTPDATVLGLAGVAPGEALTPATLGDVHTRLERSGRFRSVEVRKRYASIADPSQIIVVIVIEERAGVSLEAPDPGPLRALGASTMWLPVLDYEDGYGWTYGARFSFVDLVGPKSRISVPLTWGGERRAAVEFERTFERGPLTRVAATGGVWRRENPAYDVGDRREEIALRAERAITPWLRAGIGGGLADVAFGDLALRSTDEWGRRA